MSDVLTVLTLNLWNRNHWDERREEVVRWIELLEPDLVGLQEVDQTGSDCQAAWLGRRTGLAAVFAGVERDGDRRFGNAVLSRWPVAGTDWVPLTALDEPDEGRLCLRVDVDSPRGVVSFFTTHLNFLFHHGRVREAQAVQVSRFVASAPAIAFPVVLTGDFNAVPDASEIRFLKGRTSLQDRSFHLHDAYEVAHPGSLGHTWDNRNPYAAKNQVPDQRIDYVFVGVRTADGAGRVLDAEVVCDHPIGSTWASDHFGVVARLAFPPRAS